MSSASPPRRSAGSPGDDCSHPKRDASSEIPLKHGASIRNSCHRWMSRLPTHPENPGGIQTKSVNQGSSQRGCSFPRHRSKSSRLHSRTRAKLWAHTQTSGSPRVTPTAPSPILPTPTPSPPPYSPPPRPLPPPPHPHTFLVHTISHKPSCHSCTHPRSFRRCSRRYPLCALATRSLSRPA